MRRQAAPEPTDQSRQHRLGAAGGFVSGLLAGGAGIFLTVLLPVVGVVLLALGVAAAIVLAKGDEAERLRHLSTAAGFLIGSGALFLYGSWNTISACTETTDYCGNANVVPLLAVAIGPLVVGFVVAARAVVSARGRGSH